MEGRESEPKLVLLACVSFSFFPLPFIATTNHYPSLAHPESFLALVTSFLYYLPAFFLQKFVAFLEVPSNPDPSAPARSLAWGYAFCLGLLVAALLDAVVSGQLWFVSNSMLATRLRTQLNCLVFDKTLKVSSFLSATPLLRHSNSSYFLLNAQQRKDVAGVSASNRPEGSGESGAASPGGETADKSGSGLFDFGTQDETFGSRSAVLNLFTIDVDRFVVPLSYGNPCG